MIYVDAVGTIFRKKKRYHLIAENKETLHTFANQCGIKRCWFHYSNNGIPHYDITEEQKPWS